MTTLAEQVAGLEVGDWVEATQIYGEYTYKTTGPLSADGEKGLRINDVYIRWVNGDINEALHSITRVPRPIPSEPGFGHFALLKVDGDFDIAKNYRGAEYEDRWAKFAQDEWHSWPEVYPLIIRLYTPSGDLVEGFEYAGGSK